MFLHFDTYVFESAQKAMSCMISITVPIWRLSQNVDFITTMMHPIRTIDTVLEHLKVILSVFESHRDIPVSLGNTWSTSVDPNVDQNV